MPAWPLGQLSGSPATFARSEVVWHIDNLSSIGGHAVSVVGSPRVVKAPFGRAVEFDGKGDGLFLDVNPIAGLQRFTVEAFIEPAADGPAEQRFLHLAEDGSENRAMLETRILPGGTWCLDTFLRHDPASLTLIDRSKTHPASAWHAVALVYDGEKMSHFVDGIRDAEGAVAFAPIGPGRTSIGVRQNKVSWFKGKIGARPRDAGGAVAGAASACARCPSADARRHGRSPPPIRRQHELGSWRRRPAQGRSRGRHLPQPHHARRPPGPLDPEGRRRLLHDVLVVRRLPGPGHLALARSGQLGAVGPALFKNVGSVWAPDLVKHRGRYYIYFPGIGPYRSNYVIWADDIRGPWSDPIDLKIGRIDPGHAVGPDGTRYLFLSAGYLVQLAADGLSVAGAEKKIYDGWKYPDDWVVEGFAQEGPKILRHGDYYYMVLAEGGTAGPPTGHMIVSARSRSRSTGPGRTRPTTRSCARNRPPSAGGRRDTARSSRDATARGTWSTTPTRTASTRSAGRRCSTRSSGRRTDGSGWRAADPAQPMAKPAGEAVAHGFALSDDFSKNRMGVQWGFYKGNDTDRARYRYENGTLVLKAKGKSPTDCSPLSFVTGDHAYEIEVEIDADPGATAGLLLFYSSRLYAGLGYSATNFFMHSYGLDRPQAKPSGVGQALHIRIRNDRHIVTMDYSADGRTWQRFDRGMELSGYHHNVAYEFLSLRPAIYAAGTGEVRFRHFEYRALE